MQPVLYIVIPCYNEQAVLPITISIDCDSQDDFNAMDEMVGIGISGEYIGKIYLEVKQRPRYIISQRTDAFGRKNNPDQSSETGAV